MIKTVIFDMDGTLTDPMRNFKRNLEYSLSKLGKSVPSDEELKKWVGPPLGESLKNFLNLSKEEAELALSFYRENYRKLGLGGNDIYKGVKDMIVSLYNRGIKIGLATAKLEEFAIGVLKMHYIYSYFSIVSGATQGGERIFKGQILAHALKSLTDEEKSETVMVGDRFHDILGARENGIKTIGVTWGYGDEEELKSYGADFIAKTPNEVVKIVTNDK